MQLDRTSIVITQRNNDEVLDLSLVVFRTYWKKLISLAIIGVLPFALLNFILLSPITDYVSLVMASRDFTTVEGLQIRYLWTMMSLVFVQAPLAMAGVSYYLGQAVFTEEPSLKQVTRVVASRFLSLLLVLGILRGGMIGLLFALWLFANPISYLEWPVALWSILGILAFFLVRCFRPFAPEILLLERCPLRKKANAPAEEQSYSKRSSWLHAGSGDLFGIELGISLIAIVFICTMCGGCLFLNGVIVGFWNWGWWMDLIFFPLILWVTALWDTVIRFLLYLNTRIRLEGWEIYLRLNAEVQRLQEARS
jgi:hypothetical protein